MGISIDLFLEFVFNFIDESLHNELFQLLYGFIAVAFVVVIISKIIEIGR